MRRLFMSWWGGGLLMILVFGGIWWGCMVPAAASGQNQGPEEVILKSGNMAPSLVPHWEHQNVLGTCDPCHGTFPKRLGAIDELKAQGELKRKAVMRLCLDCHKQRTESGAKAGPTRCRDCHRRELKQNAQ